MDVILDSNIYLALLESHGQGFLSAGNFASLMAYLRRTDSRLLIPHPVLLEVLARYTERTAQTTQKATSASTSLQKRLMTTTKVFPPFVKLDAERTALTERLLHPATGVTVMLLTDYTGVPLEEVVRRGADRIRPANPNGEELRDVIIWLMALSFASNHKQALAFVSADQTFQANDGKLHPTLADDLTSRGVSISFYASIDEFIAANALESIPITLQEADALIAEPEILRLLNAALIGATLTEGTIKHMNVRPPVFKGGTKYRVATNSFFLELSYAAPLYLVLEPPPRMRLVDLAKQWNAATNATFMAGAWGQSDLESLNPVQFPATRTGKPITVTPTVTTYATEATLGLSARLNEQKIDALEITTIKFSDLVVSNVTIYVPLEPDDATPQAS